MNDAEAHLEDARVARNVLVTSASRKAPLLRAMKDALHRIDPAARVIAGDLDPEAPARYVADDFWHMPPLSDTELPALIQGCRAREITVVFPTRDGELVFWAIHRERLSAAGISVVLAGFPGVQRCLDKLDFARFGRKLGLPVIDTAETPEAVGAGPYVVKERFGAGARGIGLDLSLDAAREHGRTLKAPIYQRFVPGPEISIDAWLDRHGAALGVVLRRRDRVVAGESQVTTTFRHSVLESEAVRALEALELRGPVVMQAIIRDERLQIIECNPRFGGASTTSIAAGLDSLYWSLGEAFGKLERPTFKRVAGEVRLVRLPTDLVLHDSDF